MWEQLSMERKKVDKLVSVVNRLWDVVQKGFPGNGEFPLSWLFIYRKPDPGQCHHSRLIFSLIPIRTLATIQIFTSPLPMPLQQDIRHRYPSISINPYIPSKAQVLARPVPTFPIHTILIHLSRDSIASNMLDMGLALNLQAARRRVLPRHRRRQTLLLLLPWKASMMMRTVQGRGTASTELRARRHEEAEV